MGDAEYIRNLFDQVGRGGRGSLTIDDLCLSVIAPPLMEKIRDDLIGDKIQINKQTSDEWRLVSVSNPNSVSAGLWLDGKKSVVKANHFLIDSERLPSIVYHFAISIFKLKRDGIAGDEGKFSTFMIRWNINS